MLLPLEDDNGWRIITDVTGRLVEVWLVRGRRGLVARIEALAEETGSD
jgi:hypothetical protein